MSQTPQTCLCKFFQTRVKFKIRHTLFLSQINLCRVFVGKLGKYWHKLIYIYFFVCLQSTCCLLKKKSVCPEDKKSPKLHLETKTETQPEVMVGTIQQLNFLYQYRNLLSGTDTKTWFRSHATYIVHIWYFSNFCTSLPVPFWRNKDKSLPWGQKTSDSI